MEPIAQADVLKAPNVLYHYTSLDCLDKILRSETLRLYSFNTMNDISEGKWIEPLIQESFDKNNLDRTIQTQFWNYYTINRAVNLWCLFSFTEDGNSLNQWILYANHGRGVSIGFRIADLMMPVTIPAQLVHSFHSLGLFKIIYELKWQRKLVDEIVGPLKLLSLKGPSAINASITEMVPTLIKLSIAFKSEGFKGEGEWRIIDAPTPIIAPGITIPPYVGKPTEGSIKYDISANSLREFTEIKLNDLFKNGKEDIIEILIGPDSRIDQQALLEYFISEFNMSDIKISKSTIPYRNTSSDKA